MYDYIIIGGGISGLFLLNQMAGSRQKIALFEKNDHFGGKLMTQYDAFGNIEYETGPWRIATTHHKMIALCKTLNIELQLVKKEVNVYIDRDNNVDTIAIENYDKEGGMSVYDQFLYKTDKIYSDHIENKTGYNEILNMASVINAYDANTKHETYYVLPLGFSYLIKKLIETLPHSWLHKCMHVSNVFKKNDFFVVSVRKRIGPNLFLEKRYKTKNIIVACPPSSIKSWSVAKDIDVLFSGIQSYPLSHIYALCREKPAFQQSLDFHIFTSDTLSQIISSNYQNNWIQISYSGGRIAEYWDHLYLNHKKKWRDSLLTHLKKFVKTEIIRLKHHYWSEAIHMWMPAFHLDLDRVYKLAMEPNPVQLKNLYIIGESFSKNQGWCEGALETVHDLLSLLKSNSQKLLRMDFPFVIYKNRILNVGRWMNVHPGTKEAIQNHLYEDISVLWDTIHMTSNASRHLLSLQVGWKKDDNFYHV
jgi:hypothetical protein